MTIIKRTQRISNCYVLCFESTTKGFTDHEHLDAVNLIHMNGRVYDPLIGRFLSPDDYVQFPESSQSYNRYTYVLNNPLSYTDPTGELAFLTAAGIFLAVNAVSLSIDVATRPDADECNGCAAPASGIDVGSLAASAVKLSTKATSKASTALKNAFEGAKIEYKALYRKQKRKYRQKKMQ